MIDLNLPDMDGLEILRLTFPGAIKMMLTGYHSLISSLEATDLCIDAYLRKPERPEELLLIKTGLAQRRDTTH